MSGCNTIKIFPLNLYLPFFLCFFCLFSRIIWQTPIFNLKATRAFFFTVDSLLFFLNSFTCRIEIEETTVSGSFNMIFLHHSIALGYRNHTNIVMRYLGIWIVICIGLLILCISIWWAEPNLNYTCNNHSVVLFRFFPQSFCNICLQAFLFLINFVF